MQVTSRWFWLWAAGSLLLVACGGGFGDEPGVGPYNTPPTILIRSPVNAQTVEQGETITFKATAADSEDFANALRVEWKSSIDGVLLSTFDTPSETCPDLAGNCTFYLNTLSIGTHAISVTVLDSGAVSASDEITLVVTEKAEPPTCQVLTPAVDATFTEGEAVSFTGQAADPNGDLLSLRAIWASDIDGQLGEERSPDPNGYVGITTAGEGDASADDRVLLSPGRHTITLFVEDPTGLDGYCTRFITVVPGNGAPTASIGAPADGSIYRAGEPVRFTGQVDDDQDAPEALGIVWASDLDGELNVEPADSSGNLDFVTSALTVGLHEVTLAVTDAGGKTTVASTLVFIEAPNTAPVARILGVEPATTVLEGSSVTVRGQVSDLEDGPQGIVVSWTSSLQGPLLGGSEPDGDGNVSLSTSALVVGIHTITLKVEDADGLRHSASALVTIQGQNQPPTARLTSPDTGTYLLGTPLLLGGVVDDVEDDAGALTLVWTSSLDGDLGGPTAADNAGNVSFVFSELSVGTHQLSLRATDSGGAAASDSRVLTIRAPNQAPSAEFTGPAETVFALGDTVIFSAVVGDPEDAADTLHVVLTSDKNGQICEAALPDSAGNFVCSTAELVEGTHLVTLRVTDADGASASASLVLNMEAENRAPVVSLSAPVDGAVFSAGVPIAFRAFATDAEDAEADLVVSWESNLDGEFNTDAPDDAGSIIFTYTGLSVGTHEVTLRVEDSGGAYAVSNVVFKIVPPNSHPTAEIVSPPTDGLTFVEGQAIQFEGEVGDAVDAPTDLDVRWISDRDGELNDAPADSAGVTQFTTATLSVGTHTISLRVEDTGGLVAVASRVVSVRRPNAPPTVQIAAPVDGLVATEGDVVTFQGLVGDVETPATALGVAWRSDLDGLLNTLPADAGGTLGFTFDGLSVGVHFITLQATDADGATSSAGVTVRIDRANTPPSASISAPAGGAVYVEGTQVVFVGQVSDPDQAATTLAVSWTSDLDGTLNSAAADSSGKTTFASGGLSVGTHLITLRVQDNASAVATATLSVSVRSRNTPPTVTLSSPLGGTYVQGSILTFAGKVGDAEDDPRALGVQWQSSLLGAPFNTAASDAAGNLAFTFAGLPLGTQLVTLRVTDTEGLTSTASVTVTIRRPNALPTVAISAPTTGLTVFSGTPVTFTATVGDTEDVATSLDVVWSSDLDGVISTTAANSSGLTQLTKADLSLGTHFITCTVTDSDGGVGSASVTVTVRAPNSVPTVTLTAPTATLFFAGDLITFKGKVSDAEDAETALGIQWSSNRDGVLSSLGADAAGNVVFATAALSVGTHILTLRATDTDGVSATDTMTLTIRAVNASPDVEIVAPSDGVVVTEGQTVSFQANVDDAEDAATALDIEWRSDLDGVLNTDPANAGGVASFSSASLGVGTHTITLRVTDLDGAVSTDQIIVTVVGPNRAPTANLTAPVEGLTFLQGSAITFRGVATDTEDANATLTVTFTSDRDGLFKTTNPDAGGNVVFSYAGLGLGTHFISMRVQDSQGAAATDGIVLTIRGANTAPTATIQTPADGAQVFVGSAVVFTGVVSDVEDAEASLVVTWTSSTDGVLGSSTPDSAGNVSLTTSGLSLGQHTITLSVTDTEAGTGSDLVTLTVRSPNQAPTASITAPVNGATFFQGATLVFVGRVNDAEDPEDQLGIRWSSTLVSGDLSTTAADSGGTATFSTAALPVGQHVITLRVTDLDGASANASVTITIRPANRLPTVTLTGPSGTAYVQGQTVGFTASASDVEDAANLLTYEFVSNLQGSLSSGTVSAAGTISYSIASLSVGTHTITVKVTDRDGGIGTDDMQISVRAPNVAPSAAITAPASGATFNVGAAVLFQGTGTDPEDAESALTWSLSSSLSGLLGSGNPSGSGSFSFSTSGLPAGTHTITLTVTDLDGATDTDSITVIVVVPNVPPTLNITTPTSGVIVEAGTSVTFSTVSTDSDAPVTDLTVACASNIDGAMSSGAPNAGGVYSFADASLSVGTHVVTCTATDAAGGTATKTVTVVVIPANTAPTVAITAPTTGVTVDSGATVLFRGTAVDAESAETALTIEWRSSLVSSGPLDVTPADSSGNVGFSSSSLPVGTHTITLKATDPNGLFATASITLIVKQANRPPTAPVVNITPSTARTSDNLLAVITTNSTDPDGDTITYGYQWFKNGVAQTGLTTDTLLASFTAKGEVWKVRVTPSDGTTTGPFAEASRTISNTAPSVSAVTLSPTTAYEATTLNVSVTGFSDPDGDGSSSLVEWFVDGVLAASNVSSLTGSAFSKGQVVTVRVTPSDGTDSGTPVFSNAVTISNTPPTAPTVAITPSDPNLSQNLVCTVTAASTDADGDAITYLYEWYKNDVFHSAESRTSLSATLAASNTGLGQGWRCEVTPNDGDDDGPTASASVTVLPDAGDLVITELMINPAAVADSQGEWIELRNVTTHAIPLDGFVVRDASTDTHTISSGGALTVAAGARVVLGRDDRVALNGGATVDYQYTNNTLTDGGDAVTVSYAGRVIDTVTYVAGQVAAGRSLTLDPGTETAAANDLAANWCLATSTRLTAGDFASPKLANEACACDDSDGDVDAYGDDLSCTIDDCNDANAAISPSAVEICGNAVDENCDGVAEACSCLSTDSDGDGYGTGSACALKDCNDANAAINPGATEVCDGVDNDCDLSTDEGFDVDGDGYLTCSVGGAPVDCDDNVFVKNPGRTEICDDYDNDCDGTTNEGFDGDGDGNYSCAITGRSADCNDANAAMYQGNTESCDDYDNNCDGNTNEGFGDSWEANNSLAAAKSLGSRDDTTYVLTPAATIHTATDTADFYTVTVVDDGLINVGDGFYFTVRLTNIPSGNNYDLYVTSPVSGQGTKQSTNSSNTNESVTFSASSSNDSGTYTIEVRRVSGFSCSPYSLEIQNDQ